jgi:hypothetical protein
MKANTVKALRDRRSKKCMNEKWRNLHKVNSLGAAYLNGGLLGWEFAFCTVMTGVAYWGLKDYRLIGIGWLLHTAWDTVHHLYGTPIVPFVPLSSFGCAICDSAIALWYFQGAPSVFTTLNNYYRSN